MSTKLVHLQLLQSCNPQLYTVTAEPGLKTRDLTGNVPGDQ